MAFVCWTSAPALAEDAPAKLGRRNVVLIVADDLGLQLGCYGDKLARTPNLDRLAASSTRFTRACCTTASCSASRSVLLTGLYNHATGHYGHSHERNHFSTLDGVRSLPVLLSESGYRTCSIGKYHVAPESVYHFDAYRNEGTQGDRHTLRMAWNAKEWIAEKDSRPFFLYFCPADPHRGRGPGGFANYNDQPGYYPGIESVKFSPQAMSVPSWLPDLPETRQELAEFYQATARLDAGIGALLDALQSTGHAQDTLVIFLSDNGAPFPGAKTTLYEPGINLPLIVRDPRATRRGITCDARACWADITPTILDFCEVTPPSAPPILPIGSGMSPHAVPGKKVPYTLHGRSFLKTLDQEHPAGWDEVYLSHTFHEVINYYPMRGVIRGKYKYLVNLAHPLSFPFAFDLNTSATWQAVKQRGEKRYGLRTVEGYLHRPRYELYDLTTDPNELHNLADDPRHRQTVDDLQTRLAAWQKQTQDPWILKYDYE
jgi:N-sulfoglucosamine sulfohydrolase